MDSDRSIPVASPFAPGYRLDRYELLCPIAEGGMATVWLARLTGKHGFEKLVAMKMILPKFTQDDRFVRMFLDEARIASRIEHVNVAQIFDLGDERGVLYLAMEWVDGDPLSKLYRTVMKTEGSFPHGILLRLLADASGGLSAAHELRGKDRETLGVVHRDVSPENILVSMRGVAKVIDFGIAKARDRRAEETSQGLLKGKVRYMPPEQALGQPVDRRADVWALGAILYHLLAGRAPFEGANQYATLHLLTAKKPPIPLPGTVHPAIVAVVRRALEHNPDKRFSGAAEMQDALEAAIVSAKLTTTTADVGAFMQKHLADRARRRQEMLELALAAASDRAAFAEKLQVGKAEGLERSSIPDDSPGLDSVARAAVAQAEASASAGARVATPTTNPSGASSGLVVGNAGLPRRNPAALMAAAAVALVVVAATAAILTRRRPDGSGVEAHASASTMPESASGARPGELDPAAVPAVPEPPPTGAAAPSDDAPAAATGSAAASGSHPVVGRLPGHGGAAPQEAAPPGATPAKPHHRSNYGF